MAIDMKVWNKKIDDAFKAKQITKEDKFELRKKFVGEHKNLTEEEAENFFKSKVGSFGGSGVYNYGKWTDAVRREFFPQIGPQYQRLLDKIKSQKIKTQQEFEKEMEIERKDLKSQLQNLQELKKKIHQTLNDSVKGLSDVAAKDEKLDEIEKGIDSFALYDIVRARGEGKSEAQILSEINDVYTKTIDIAVSCIENEFKFYKMVNSTISSLRNTKRQTFIEVAKEIENVLNTQGPSKAYDFMMRKSKGVDNSIKEAKSEVKILKQEREVITMSKLELEKFKKAVEGNPENNNYKYFRVWITKGKNAYKIEMENFLNDIDNSKRKFAIEKCGKDTTWVMFADQKDYRDCCANVQNEEFYSAKDEFMQNAEELLSDANKNSKMFLTAVKSLMDKQIRFQNSIEKKVSSMMASNSEVSVKNGDLVKLPNFKDSNSNVVTEKIDVKKLINLANSNLAAGKGDGRNLFTSSSSNTITV